MGRLCISEVIQMKIINEIAKTIGCTQTQQIVNLISDMGWDYDRMSESGQKTYDQLLTILELGE